LFIKGKTVDKTKMKIYTDLYDFWRRS
jgi:hypothetical protein